MSRYVPNGTPLTDYERELLVIMMEECAEVTQAASKLLRFGKKNRPDTGVSNSLVLAGELGDLAAVISMVEHSGLVESEQVVAASILKRGRLEYFMQNAAANLVATGKQE